MAPTLSRVSAATVAFWITTTTAVGSLGALTAIAVLLGINDTKVGTQIHSLVLAAIVLDILSLGGALAAATLFLLRVSRRARLFSCVGLVGLATAAALVNIYSFAWLWNTVQDDDDDATSVGLIQAGFAVWAIAALAQILLYALVLWPYNHGDSGLPASELALRLQQVQSSKRSLSVRLASLSTPRTSPLDRSYSEPMASHFSTPSLSPRSSFRRSLTQAIRPMTSRTRLLLRSSIISRDSPSLYSARESSSEVPRPHNEFRDWDTSGAMGTEDHLPQNQNDAFIPSRSTRTRLEPIPGSRPVSPAKPLDGPFHLTGSSPPEDLPLPDSPLASPSLTGSIRTTRPRAPSRPHSNHSQEAHIHPLFRSESPNPPPIASPGTIITASPYAGQVVGSEHQAHYPPGRMLRSATGSRPASPSPLSPVSPARSRQGSCRSLRGMQSSPAELRSGSALSWEACRDG